MDGAPAPATPQSGSKDTKALSEAHRLAGEAAELEEEAKRVEAHAHLLMIEADNIAGGCSAAGTFPSLGPAKPVLN